MIDLTTQYLGLTLRSPLVCSSSPLCESVDNLQKMEAAGAGAVVLHSLFEEQLERESLDLHHNLEHGSEGYAESLSYFPEMESYNFGPEGYLDLIRRAKKKLDIPVIASLNGSSMGGWTGYAFDMEQAGADALELNVYWVPTSATMTGAEVEQRYIDLIGQVRSVVRIPVAIKLSPFFSAPAHFATQLDDAGASGLVLFNRFYQPDFDLEKLEVAPSLHLSNSSELLLRLHWVAILFGQIKADMAVTGGVHSHFDVLKVMMAGGKVAMMTSALLQRGISHLAKVRDDLATWMKEHDYESIRQMQGSMSLRNVADPAAFERANYMKVLRSYALRATP